MKRKLIIIIFSITIILTSIVTASLYTEKFPISSKFTSIMPLWSAFLEAENGEKFTISLFKYEFEYGNKEEGFKPKSMVLAQLDDGKNKYLVDNFRLEKDIIRKKYLLGCLNGASFSQKFTSIFKMLVGGKPFSINEGEEQEFEKEGWSITNTPGTGAFNSKTYLDDCIKTHVKPKQKCDISSVCPLPIKAKKNFRQCSKEVVSKFKCGEFYECNTYAPDGLCGVEQVQFIILSNKKVVIYDIILSLNPESGKLIPGENLVNGQAINIAEQEGDFYSIREALYLNTINKNILLYFKE